MMRGKGARSRFKILTFVISNGRPDKCQRSGYGSPNQFSQNDAEEAGSGVEILIFSNLK